MSSTPHSKSEGSNHSAADTEVDSAKRNLFSDDDVVFKEDKYPPVKLLHRKQGSWMEILTPEEYNQPETPPSITLDPPLTDTTLASITLDPPSLIQSQR